MCRVNVRVQEANNWNFNLMLFCLSYSFDHIVFVQWCDYFPIILDTLFNPEPQVPGNQDPWRQYFEVVNVNFRYRAAQLKYVPKALGMDEATLGTFFLKYAICR